jgi:tetratricopeptide (TPR) repeat protein
MRASQRRIALLVSVALLVGCAAAGTSRRPLRVSDVEENDPARRASLQLVSRGLSQETAAPQLAVSDFERAIQIDPANPYAYLALARHYATRDPDRALEYLDQAEALLESEDALSPGVEPHLLGIRGTALRTRGDVRRGDELIDKAASLAPHAWEDGVLSPDELR